MFIVSCNEDDDMDDMVEENPSLVEAAESAGLTTLLDAVNAVDGLAGTLLDADDITVFAPTNEAFGDLLTATGTSNLTELVEAIGGIENLETVLGYHVVASSAFAADLSDGQTLNTLAGQSLTVNVTDAGVSISDVSGNTFNVVTADVAIENGVVHVISGVLLPELPMEEVMNPGLVEAATEAGLSILLEAVTAVDGLATTLTEAEAVTVFAPTDEAFGNALAAYGVDNLDELVAELGGIDNLAAVLGFHVVPAVAFAADLADGEQSFETLAGQNLTVTKTGDGVTVTDANGTTYNVVTADVAIDNGVVHVIDGVLLPSIDLPNVVEAATAADLTTLLDAVTAANLGSTLTGADAITVFAPTNDAFGAALQAYGVSNLDELVAELGGLENLSTVLGFHVVPAVAFSHDLADGEQTFETLAGQTLTVNKSTDGVMVTDANGTTYMVMVADVAIENGVVHVINGVLLPSIDLPNIVEAGTSAGLTTLLDAVTAASLGDALTGAEAITVFAPTNDAFGGLLERDDATDLTDLVSKIGLDAVTQVLQFHVVPAVAFSHDLANGEQTFTTLQGQELTVNRSENGVTVTDYLGFTYNVSLADVAIENGVVHVIDGVVLPDLSDDPNVVEAATSAGLTTLIDAVVAAELGDALIQATEITVFAPTNDAFADLLAAQNVSDLAGLINALGAEAVTKVLQFHVVPTVAFSTDLAEGDQTVPTLAGENLSINRTGSAVTVTDAAGNTYNVTTADVAIENGVVHVIDGVLLPTL